MSSDRDPDAGFWRDLKARFLNGGEVRADYEETDRIEDRWFLDADPVDVVDVKQLAAEAAIALGCTWTDYVWVHWFEILRTESTLSESALFRYHGLITSVDRDRITANARFGTIAHVRKASAHVCGILESEQHILERLRARAQPSSPSVPASDVSPTQAPKAPPDPPADRTWFESLVHQRGHTINSLAAKVECNSGTLYKWRDGQTRRLRPDDAEKIAKELGIDPKAFTKP
jgi:hypothetical protein